MDRRDALRLLGALTLPRCAFAGSPRKKIKAIGLQLYTVRAALEADFDGTLARVAAIGYREVEFAGYFGHILAPGERKSASRGTSSRRPRTSRSMRSALNGQGVMRTRSPSAITISWLPPRAPCLTWTAIGASPSASTSRVRPQKSRDSTRLP
jgi:hypothetical protein